MATWLADKLLCDDFALVASVHLAQSSKIASHALLEAAHHWLRSKLDLNCVCKNLSTIMKTIMKMAMLTILLL